MNPPSVFGNCFYYRRAHRWSEYPLPLDTGPEVTTMSETHFNKLFKGKALSPAKWVKLTAANGLDIPIIGCLYADIECFGKKLQGKCVFVLRDDMAEGKSGPAGILGMNVLGELRNLFCGLEGVQRMDRHRQRVESILVKIWVENILVKIGKEEQIGGSDGKIDFVKEAGKRAVVIPP